MSEHFTHSCEACPLNCPSVASGMTADCLRVQTDVVNLAEFLRTAMLDDRADLPQRSLEAVRRTRQELREHTAWIEGSAGLFQYVGEGAAWLVPQIQCLSQQHCELDRCLEELEMQLGSYAPAHFGTQALIRHTAGRLLEAMHQHQTSAAELAAEAYQA